jgi:type II restriction/modification system DNA methylase subunit YeeA
MTPQQFITKWRRTKLSERAAAQEHFLDLCELLGQPKPAEADPDGTEYTFERGVSKTGGGDGWADVWKRGHFGWEYKGKHKDLTAAYKQLLDYREDLENPPLLVVCDMDRFEVHTNFTATAKRRYAFDLDGLAIPENFDVLRRLFTDPDSLRPDAAAVRITQQAAKQFQNIAEGLRVRGVEAHRAAHFLMKIIFCLFAEDIELLQEKLFTKILAKTKDDSARLAKQMRALFEAMAAGGDFGEHAILHFNGGLFADADVIELRLDEIRVIMTVSQFGWEHVEPSIFGTLFERLLDPDKRSQIGAHYTSKEDILTLVEPVLMAPLRREWEEVKQRCETVLRKIAAKPKTAGKRPTTKASKEQLELEKLLQGFLERLAHVTVLDPACGSGNFLYVALNLLLDLERDVIGFAAKSSVSLLPLVRPTQLAGIEINPYAQELAQVVVWIGFLQWKYQHGFATPRHPVLDPVETIRRMDAILDLSDPAHPREPDWPAADVIVGNPPFLGGKLLRTNLGDDYVNAMFTVWDERVPREADLCCYWFEKGRDMIKRGKAGRVGLLATQGIRGGANREVLKRIKNSGDIFFAESDRDWVLDGANVHVSMVGFDKGSQKSRVLDGKAVVEVNANLSNIQADITEAKRMTANSGTAFMGVTPSGKFEVAESIAQAWLHAPNPSGCLNSSVLRVWRNGTDITSRPRDLWIIDFGCDVDLRLASQFEAPFEHVKKNVAPKRATYRTGKRGYWCFERPRPEMRAALDGRSRFVATTMVAKHRMFVWLGLEILPANLVIAFARDDDYFFGVLHSRLHEVWALKLGTRLETRPRYTPTTCFETFPFPQPTPGQEAAIAEAARELDKLRSNSLNPPEWTREEVLEFPGSVDGPWRRYVHDPDSRGIGTVRYPRRVPKDDECAKELAKRTLTNLYNQRPTWLVQAHYHLDVAVFAAYGWDAAISDDELLAKLLALNLERMGST